MRKVYTSTARLYLRKFGTPIYATDNVGVRFRVMSIGSKYVTSVNGQKLLLREIQSFDLG